MEFMTLYFIPKLNFPYCKKKGMNYLRMKLLDEDHFYVILRLLQELITTILIWCASITLLASLDSPMLFELFKPKVYVFEYNIETFLFFFVQFQIHVLPASSFFSPFFSF